MLAGYPSTKKNLSEKDYNINNHAPDYCSYPQENL